MHALLVVLALATGTDAGLSSLGLARGDREMNPLLPQHRVVHALVMSGLIVAESYGLSRLAPSHPTLAREIGTSALAVEGVAIAVNIHVLRRH